MTVRPVAAVAALLLISALPAEARDLSADPSNYRALVSGLAAGDTLHLAGGDYQLLSLQNLNGSPAAWVTVEGPESGTPATFHADPGGCCNTVQIKNSSYVALENVTIDGGHIDGAFGISASGGVVHDVLIEGCTLVNHDGGQQHDGISTKVPTWGWTIRRNRIVGVGTGLYLGNSDGSDPFIGGVIEDNLVSDPIGYCMEIKWQKPRPSVAGMPAGPSTTIIRNNVFIKNDGPSPDGDRPNVLVGGFPATGPGSEDRYEIYGNLFFHNPRESLLQASGRVTIHDNVFVDSAQNAITLQDHDLPLEQAYVYNNTIYGVSSGVRFGNAAKQGDGVVGNLIFAGTPIAGPITDQRDNLGLAVSAAPSYVAAPSLTLGQMDFYPLADKCEGTALDLSKFASDRDYDRDFNGSSKGGLTFRGAYAGDGVNPGWPLAAGIKAGGRAADGGVPGAGGTASGGGSGGGLGGGSNGAGADSGADSGSNGAAGADSGSGGGSNGTGGSGVNPETGGGSSGTGAAAGRISEAADSGLPGARPGAAGNDGGCGCRSPGTPPEGGPPVMMGLVIASALVGRRKRRGVLRSARAGGSRS